MPRYRKINFIFYQAATEALSNSTWKRLFLVFEPSSIVFPSFEIITLFLIKFTSSPLALSKFLKILYIVETHVLLSTFPIKYEVNFSLNFAKLSEADV